MIARIPRLIPSIVAAGMWLAPGLWAAPSLTTIQDVLYKADGTRFNGTAVIGWKSFEASDTSAITMHNLTVKIVDGQFRVQLVPNAGVTPPVYYTVKYGSDGKVQFEETWSVPASARPVRLRDVRVTAPAAVEAGTSLQESDVVGLAADLNARPIRGPGFSPGRAAVITLTGAVESATGNPADCVRVDGSSGPCGTGGGGDPGFIDNESPSGTVDGANATFRLAATPMPSTSLAAYRNGILLKAGLDYALADRVVTFVAAAIPQPGDTLLASYRRQGSTPSAQAQVLCSSTGQSTSVAAEASLGVCVIAPTTLGAGDRLEVLFDYAHTGTQSGFTAVVKWGGTTVASRDAAAAETLVTGRAEAAVGEDGVQIGVQSWGATLPMAVGVVTAADSTAAPLTIDFRGKLATASADTLKLKTFTVLRYPAL